MATIHEQIDELLAADLHDELTAAERDAIPRPPRRVRGMPPGFSGRKKYEQDS